MNGDGVSGWNDLPDAVKRALQYGQTGGVNDPNTAAATAAGSIPGPTTTTTQQVPGDSAWPAGPPASPLPANSITRIPTSPNGSLTFRDNTQPAPFALPRQGPGWPALGMPTQFPPQGMGYPALGTPGSMSFPGSPRPQTPFEPNFPSTPTPAVAGGVLARKPAKPAKIPASATASVPANTSPFKLMDPSEVSGVRQHPYVTALDLSQLFRRS